MGSGWIVDRLDPDESLASGGVETRCVLAPSLCALPSGSPLVVATLPVLDWNAALLGALQTATQIDRPRCYAAMMMIDPFALWEDLADLLKSRGIQGVVNFPPALVAEGSPISAGVENAIEIERLRWFSDVGFKLAFAASSDEEAANAAARLPGLIEMIVRLPADIWRQPSSKRVRVSLRSPTQESAGS